MFDFVIVGSGVSGGRMADVLTESGARVAILEAGPEFNRKTFPNNERDSSSRMFWGGGLEISKDGRLGLLRGRVVGGTSIVNQALLDRFDADAWGAWKDYSGVPFFTEDLMESHYAASEAALSISEIPERHYNRNARLFIEAFGKTGYGWKPLQRAQGDCQLDKGSDCIVCLGGCPRDSKQSALVIGIRGAVARGAKLESEFEVARIETRADHIKVLGVQRGKQVEVKGKRLVLAGGALGNTAILLKSGFASKLPALGSRFTCHPQFMTYAFFEEPIDAHKGAFQSVKSDDPKLRKAGYKLENVYAPPIGTAMLLPGYGVEHMRRMRKYRYYASAEVALRDDAVGRVTVDRAGKIVVDKPLTDGDKQRARGGLELVKNLFASVEAKEIVPCAQGFGLHLMGGCPIGVDARSSVVDPDFRLHGESRIAIADSSVFPTAPGINPSFTIMALAHRAALGLLKG